MLDALRIGKRISISRQDKGFTQEQLATKLGITPQAVSRWERGNSIPDIEFLLPLSQLLNVPLEDLLTGNIATEEKINKEEDISKEINSAIDLLPIAEIEIKLSCSLTPLADKECGGDFLDRISIIRRIIALEWGVVIPAVRVRDSIQLAENKYIISIRGKVKAEGTAYPNMSFVFAEKHGVAEKIEGIKAEDPIFEKEIIWVDNNKIVAEYKDEFINCGSFLSAHLTEIIKENLTALITLEMVKMLVDTAAIRYPLTKEEVVPNKVSYIQLTKLLRCILNEKKSIRDMYTILNYICESDDASDISKLAKEIAAVI